MEGDFVAFRIWEKETALFLGVTSKWTYLFLGWKFNWVKIAWLSGFEDFGGLLIAGFSLIAFCESNTSVFKTLCLISLIKMFWTFGVYLSAIKCFDPVPFFTTGCLLLFILFTTFLREVNPNFCWSVKSSVPFTLPCKTSLLLFHHKQSLKIDWTTSFRSSELACKLLWIVSSSIYEPTKLMGVCAVWM